MSEEHRTFCRICTAACGLTLRIENGRIESVHGDRGHAVTQGYLCAKGRMSADWHNGEDRLTTALVRQGVNGLEAVTTEQALDTVHARLEEVIARNGPQSIGLYYGTGVKSNTFGTMALRPWLTDLGSPYLYSNSTLDQSAKWVTAGRMGVFTSGRHPVTDTDVAIVAGANPHVAHQVPTYGSNPQMQLRQAQARGMVLVVIDPRRTELARQADLHLAILPGTDAVVLAAMIRVILARQWHDQRFCSRFVTSLDRIREAVEPFTLEVAAGRADVPPTQIEEAARVFALAGRRTAISGTGPDMGPHSNLNEHLLEALNAICGAYRRAGDLAVNTGSFTRSNGVAEGVVPPRRTWEHPPFLWTEPTGTVGGEFPSSRIPQEILSGGLRGLVVVGGNPAMALGQPEKTLDALARLELLVVIDPRLHETSELADVVIPTSLPYERYDTTHLIDGLLPTPFAQIAVPAMASPEGVLDDWAVFWELSKRAGRPQRLVEYLWGGREGREYVMDMANPPSGADLARWLCESSGLSFEELLQHPEGVRYDRAPTIVQAAERDDGARLDLCPRDVADELAEVAVERAQAPRSYLLAVRRARETMNSAYRHASNGRRPQPVNHASLAREDMGREGLTEGELIRLTADAGSVVVVARSDDSVRPGVITLVGLRGRPDSPEDPLGTGGSFSGHLVSLDHDVQAINYMPRQSAIPVDLERIDLD